MLYGICGWQDSGKTLTALAIIKWLLNFGGYTQDEIIGNILFLKWPEAHSITNEGIPPILNAMIKYQKRHKIILLDEIDRVFPARTWHNAEQTKALIGLWQDEKLFNHVIYTQHMGRSSDKILKDATQLEVIPKFNRASDRISLTIVDHLRGVTFWNRNAGEMMNLPKLRHNSIPNASSLFDYYDRWEIVC